MNTNTNLKTALQKLVDKLELIEKDSYFQGNYVVSLWKNELAEAKKALEVNNKPPEVLCTGYTTTRDVDLFDIKQLDLPLKDENEF